MTSPVCNVWCVAVHGGGSPECGGEAEGPPGLGAPQLSQILGLQLHHHIVEPAHGDEDHAEDTNGYD